MTRVNLGREGRKCCASRKEGEGECYWGWQERKRKPQWNGEKVPGDRQTGRWYDEQVLRLVERGE